MSLYGAFDRVAIRAAKRAGIFIKENLGRVKTASFKGSINIVTDIDKKSEKLIIREIRKNFPEHAILAEEKGQAVSGNEYQWVIDPLDGTTNFFRSFPFFCVSIALEKRGEVIVGVVYDPMRNDLFYAKKKEGAYLNGRKIRVSSVTALARSFLATGFSYGIKSARNTNIANFGKLLKRSLAIRRAGSAALDLCYVACGIFDGFWEMDLYPWDCAAASLIVREAGGRLTRFNGMSYSHYDKEVLATNGRIHKHMVKELS